MSALSLRGLVKDFGEKRVLQGIDLELAAGELLVVLGATGAGKTTLLRLIAGLEQSTAGQILMSGTNVSALAPAERDIALVFQNFSLYPDRSVRANLEFPLRAPGRRETQATIAERVAWAAKMLAIEHLLERPAARLSGGEMQRVAIGRAIVRRPRLFLLDEPLSNLDAKLRENLRVELSAMQRELGTAMIYVTHDQAEALSMADRIALLQGGRIVQAGPPQEVYWRPRTPSVARALGSPPINLARVQARAGSWRLQSGCPVLATESGEATAVLGIRPEDLQVTAGGSGRILVVEEMGPSRILLVEWAGEHWHALVPASNRLVVGEAVGLLFAQAACLLWPETPPAP